MFVEASNDIVGKNWPLLLENPILPTFYTPIKSMLYANRNT